MLMLICPNASISKTTFGDWRTSAVTAKCKSTCPVCAGEGWYDGTTVAENAGLGEKTRAALVELELELESVEGTLQINKGDEQVATSLLNYKQGLLFMRNRLVHTTHGGDCCDQDTM